MKHLLVLISGFALASSALMMAQTAPPAAGQPMGRGRGGAPMASNDKNKDGVCDRTGRAVGEGQCGDCRRGGRRGGRRGAGAMGRGMGRGMGGGMNRGFAPQQQPAPPATAK